MKKLIDFKSQSDKDKVQDFANLHCEGNFSQAVRKLLTIGLEKINCSDGLSEHYQAKLNNSLEGKGE